MPDPQFWPADQHRPRLHFPVGQIARWTGTRIDARRQGAGTRGYAVDLVAEEELRRSYRPHGKSDSRVRASCWLGRRESLRGHRSLAGIEVRHPSQESPEKGTAERLECPCSIPL